MKTDVVCVAVLCAVTVLGQVQAAPAEVKAGQLVDRLKELLRQRHAHGGKNHSHGGHGAVDLENDGHKEVAVHSEDTGRAHSPRGPGLTQEQKNRAVEYHNELRKQDVDEGASNMEKLRWSDRLAQLAQDWADRCSWGHRPPNSFNPKDYGFQSVGENIWAWSVAGENDIPEKPIKDWYDEKKYYDYNTQYCRQEPCGHYTTVTWAQTTHVGCGYARCGYLHNAGYTNGEYMVCNYGPWGAGQQPFKKGEACSQCDRGQFYCTDDMCDSSCSSAGGGNTCACRAECKCGSQTSDCKCQCQKGYSGPACTERCEDKDPSCGANPGWPQSWCTDKYVLGGMLYDQVNEQCPKMCGHCEPGNEPCKSSRVVEHDAENLNDAELEFLIGALARNE